MIKKIVEKEEEATITREPTNPLRTARVLNLTW
jgi:hypothetical protein